MTLDDPLREPSDSTGELLSWEVRNAGKAVFREFDGWWYIQTREGGKRRQVKLAKGRENESAAYDRWHELGAHKPDVVAFLDHVLDHCKTQNSEATFDWYLYFFKAFKAWLAQEGLVLDVSELIPAHITNWLKSEKKWSKSTKNGAVRAIRRAFRWLDEEGHISSYPLKGLKAPPRGRRETIVSPEKFAEILTAIRDQQFKDLLVFIYTTGRRKWCMSRSGMLNSN